MNYKYRYLYTAILALGSIIPVWFFIANLQPISPALYAFSICMLLAIYFGTQLFNNELLVKVRELLLKTTRQKYFVVTALVLLAITGLLARLLFYYKFSYAPVSDPATFYESAIKLAAGGGSLGNDYVAFHPYLSAYNNALAFVMRFVSSPWLATIALNTFFELLSSITLFILLKKILKRPSYLPVLGFGVWMLSPLGVIFSILSLPIVIVNFFVIQTVFIAYLLIQQINNLSSAKAVLLSVVLGLTIGLGNIFRPVFIVPLIALLLLLVFSLLLHKKPIKFIRLSVVSVLISLIIFTIIQSVNIKFVSAQTGFTAAKNPSGWSMYVGSTWETNGEWREYHNEERGIICQESLAKNDFDACHDELRSKALERYKNYGLPTSVSLFIQKLYNQSSEQNYFYNAEQSLPGYSTSRIAKTINLLMVIYMLILFLLAAKTLYALAKITSMKKSIDSIWIFVALVLIGWFLSFVFVESAPRYSTVLYPLFMLLAVISVDKKYISQNGRK